MPETAPPPATTSRSRAAAHRIMSLVLLATMAAAGILWVDQARPRGARQADAPDAVLTALQVAEAGRVPGYRDVVPVLTYHAVSDTDRGEYTVGVQRFAAQMAALERAGFTTVTPSTVGKLVRGERVDLPERPLLLTFDDGVATTWIHVDPVLRRHGFVATTFLITGSVSPGDKRSYYLNEEQVRYLAGSGRWTFGGHTHSLHRFAAARGGGAAPSLSNLLVRPDGTPETLADWRARVDADLSASTAAMVERLGLQAPTAFAYPFGSAAGNDPRVRDELARLLAGHGYRLGFTGEAGRTDAGRAVAPGADALHLPRLEVRADTTVEELLTGLGGTIPTPMPREPLGLGWQGTSARCAVRGRGAAAVLRVSPTSAYGSCRPVANAFLWRDYRWAFRVSGVSRTVTAVVGIRSVTGPVRRRVELAIGESSAELRQVVGGRRSVLARVRLPGPAPSPSTVSDVVIHVSGRNVTVRLRSVGMAGVIDPSIATGGVDVSVASAARRTVTISGAVLTGTA